MSALGTLALLAAASPDLGGQRRSAGTLTETRPLGILQRCPQAGSAPAAGGEVHIRRGGSWEPKATPVEVLTRDSLRVGPEVDARLRIGSAGRGIGIVFLVPSLACHPGVQTSTVLRGLRLRPGMPAEYEVSTHTVTVGGRREERPAINVRRGGLIVQWGPGLPPLLVRMLGDTATITGTTVAMAVDSTGGEGILYLEMGSVSLSRLPGGAVRPGQLLHLRRGLPHVDLGPDAASDVRESVRDRIDAVWGPAGRPTSADSTGREVPAVPVESGRQRRRVRRAMLVGLGGVAAGFLIYSAWLGSEASGEESREGTVIIRIPL
ncbi:MAG TPA: hypothetical protein VHG28_05220 [Longimicrobiaceae bacterium]|nr:hypothetical protein [Longimicrobiaceae bacterium]